MNKVKKAFFVLMMVILSACANTSWQEKYDLGMKYLAEGNYEEAILSFTAAIEIDPKQPLAYIGRGDAYVGVGGLLDKGKEWDDIYGWYLKAETDYLTAVDLDNSIVETYYKLADVYLAIGEPGKAVDILNRGYENTGDEGLKKRAELTVMLPEGDGMNTMNVWMYAADGEYMGYDAYSFDGKGRMVLNVWHDFDHTMIYGETWVYDDENNKTINTRQETFDDSDEYEVTTDTFDGTDDMGWYWYDMENFLTDPSLEAVNGRVTMDDVEYADYDYAIYGYDIHGRVNSIKTYNSGDVLLGYCTVTYIN